ncbi:hypothetical protein AAG906_021131 [Vitis piasezkii]
MKILRSLPSKWDAKVTTIQNAKNLTKLPLEELIGSLMTYEINLAKKQQEGEDKKKKSIALKRRKKKAMMATWSESEDESSEEENEKEVANMCFMAIDELDEWMLKTHDRRNFQVCFSYKEKWKICYLWRQCKRKDHWSRQHWRLGHANMDLISQLTKMNLLEAFPK